MGKVYRRPAARNDLIEHFAYLAENAGETIANRFLDQVEASVSTAWPDSRQWGLHWFCGTPT